MKNYTAREIEEISKDYRSISRRLSYTDYEHCASNLRRFMKFIDENELIKEFIVKYNTCRYDIKKIVNERHDFFSFKTSDDKNEEISMAYQMLQYAIENLEGDYSILYGRGFYSGGKTFNDQIRKFNEDIVDPLIEYIKQYLEEVYRNKLEQERGNNVLGTGNFTFNNSNFVVNNGNVDGNLSANVTVMNDDIQKEIEELLESIKEEVISKDLDTKEEVFELISEIDENIKSNQKPKKSILTALKTLCEGAIPLATKLLEIFYK